MPDGTPLDLAGRRFGMLVCVEPAPERVHGGVVWRCRCDCGELVAVRGSVLIKRKRLNSCGCFRAPDPQRRTLEYRSWEAMKARCNPNCQEGRRVWEYYGARGITVCERWQVFENFLADMGLRPSRGHSMDRIDNSRGYEPGNCRWATRVEQARNQRPRVRTSVHP